LSGLEIKGDAKRTVNAAVKAKVWTFEAKAIQIWPPPRGYAFSRCVYLLVCLKDDYLQCYAWSFMRPPPG